MMDLASQYLKRHRLSLSMYEDSCSELADDVRIWLSESGIKSQLLWIEPAPYGDAKECYVNLSLQTRHGKQWWFHAVVLSGSLVHDAWLGQPMRLPEYVEAMFPNQAVVVEFRSGHGCDKRLVFGPRRESHGASCSQ